MLSALSAAPLSANDSAINPGGHGPSPMGEFQGDESVIRMVSEKIDIRFGKEESEVACRFVFRSGKSAGDARQTVGFPDLIEIEMDQGVIRKLETWVDGKKVESRKVRGWFHAEETGTPRSGFGDPPSELEPTNVRHADFHVIDVVFSPDREVVIERRYVAANGGNVEGNTHFSYTTHTGAVWRGTIGLAEFRVVLDGWTVEDLAFEDGTMKRPPREHYGPWCEPNLSGWKVVSPTELTMTWRDFEPAVHKTRRGIMLSTWSSAREVD